MVDVGGKSLVSKWQKAILLLSRREDDLLALRSDGGVADIGTCGLFGWIVGYLTTLKKWEHGKYALIYALIYAV
jgi:hypothetical protein